MKKRNITYFTWVCLLGCAIAFLPACSDDNDDPVTPVFPEQVEELSFQTTGTQTLTFTANTNWTLSSNKLWCKLKSGAEAAQTQARADGEETATQTLAGTAGEQTVTVVVDETLWELEDATADLTLTMGGETKTIATVTRSAQGIGIENLDKITVAYNSTTGSSATVTVKANFDWELTEESLPEWMEAGELPRKGYAGRSYEVAVSVKSDYLPFTKEGSLTFFQTEGEGKISIPAEYTGMPDDAIEITAPEKAFGWSVSADGTTYSQGTLNGEETETLSFPMDIQVMTQNNEYEVVRFVSSNQSLVVPDRGSGNDFFQVEDNGNGQLVMNAPEANTGSAREGFVLIVPKNLYASLGNNPDNLLDQETWNDVKPEYQKYIVFNFTQEANVQAGGFEITSINQSIECKIADPESELATRTNNDLGVSMDQIYQTSVPSGTELTINPMLSINEWDGSQLTSYLIIRDANFAEVTIDETWSPALSSDETYYTVQHKMTDTVVLIFKVKSDSGLVNKKALIIEVTK